MTHQTSDRAAQATAKVFDLLNLHYSKSGLPRNIQAGNYPAGYAPGTAFAKLGQAEQAAMSAAWAAKKNLQDYPLPCLTEADIVDIDAIMEKKAVKHVGGASVNQGAN